VNCVWGDVWNFLGEEIVEFRVDLREVRWCEGLVVMEVLERGLRDGRGCC